MPLIIVLVSLLCLSLSAQADNALIVGYVDFPPYEYTDSDGQASGRYIEITRKVLKEAGFEAQFIELPISRLYLYLKQGRIDVWPGLKGIPALQGHVLESRAHPTRISLRVWYIPPMRPVQTLQDLVGKRLIVINGYTYSGLIYKLTKENGFEIFQARTHESALRMLAHARGDYLLNYTDPVMETLRRYPVENLQSTILRERTASFLVSLQHPDAQTILDRIDAAWERLVKKGVVQPLKGE